MKPNTFLTIPLNNQMKYDLEFIAQALGVRSIDWFKARMGPILAAERIKLIAFAENKFTLGLMQEDEFKQMAGIFPTEEMKQERENRKELAEKSRLAAKNGLLSLLKSQTKQEEPSITG